MSSSTRSVSFRYFFCQRVSHRRRAPSRSVRRESRRDNSSVRRRRANAFRPHRDKAGSPRKRAARSAVPPAPPCSRHPPPSPPTPPTPPTPPPPPPPRPLPQRPPSQPPPF